MQSLCQSAITEARGQLWENAAEVIQMFAISREVLEVRQQALKKFRGMGRRVDGMEALKKVMEQHNVANKTWFLLNVC